MILLKPNEMDHFKDSGFTALHIHFDDTVLDVPQFIGKIPKSSQPKALTVFDASEQCNLDAKAVNSILQLNVGSIEVSSSHCEYDDFPSEIDRKSWIVKNIPKTTDDTYNRLAITKRTDVKEFTSAERIRRGSELDNDIATFLSPKLKMNYSQAKEKSVVETSPDKSLGSFLVHSFIAHKSDDGKLIYLENSKR